MIFRDTGGCKDKCLLPVHSIFYVLSNSLTTRIILDNPQSCSGINPATEEEDDIAVYRRQLVAQYEVGTVAVKLAAIRRLYQAAVWRGLRQDNPAAGLRAPKDRTARAERIKFRPLEGLRRLLEAPRGDNPAPVRDRAILARTGRLGCEFRR